MIHLKHTHLSATAAIAAALALTATPLSAQDASVPSTTAPPVQVEPVIPPPTAAPAPTIVVPDVTVPAATGAGSATTAPEPSPPAETTTVETTTSKAPATRSTTRTTTTRTTSVSRTVAPAPAVAPVAPPPAEDLAPLPADRAQVTPIAPPPPAAEATPTQSNNVIGTLGVILLALLALAILAAGLLFFRRRHPAIVESETLPRHPVAEPVDEAPLAEAPVAEPAAAAAFASTHEPVAFRRRDTTPVSGALPSNGAAVDLPATAPTTYEERTALLDRMVNARPDKANPFTDRRQRLHRARLILQSLGTTFDREPRIDLSQYPNNWPELARQYHKAA